MDTFSCFEQDISKSIIINRSKLFIIFIYKLLTDKLKSLNIYAEDFKEFLAKKECGIFFSFNSIIEKFSLLLNNSLRP